MINNNNVIEAQETIAIGDRVILVDELVDKSIPLVRLEVPTSYPLMYKNEHTCYLRTTEEVLEILKKPREVLKEERFKESFSFFSQLFGTDMNNLFIFYDILKQMNYDQETYDSIHDAVREYQHCLAHLSFLKDYDVIQDENGYRDFLIQQLDDDGIKLYNPRFRGLFEIITHIKDFDALDKFVNSNFDSNLLSEYDDYKKQYGKKSLRDVKAVIFFLYKFVHKEKTIQEYNNLLMFLERYDYVRWPLLLSLLSTERWKKMDYEELSGKKYIRFLLDLRKFYRKLIREFRNKRYFNK